MVKTSRLVKTTRHRTAFSAKRRLEAGDPNALADPVVPSGAQPLRFGAAASRICANFSVAGNTSFRTTRSLSVVRSKTSDLCAPRRDTVHV